MRYLITGGCGFIGSNLALEVLNRNEELFIFDNLSRVGSFRNYNWLKTKGDFKFYHSDIRNKNDIERVIREIQPDFIFHLAGQVAMTTSISNPQLDFETNTIGTFNLLESIRIYSPNSIVLYSSTNKVYGDLDYLRYEEETLRYTCPDHPNGLDENISTEFHSPYGCSKGAADQYLLDYSRIYGIRTSVFRHSSMYGGNQHSTEDQGWIGWFCSKALEINNGEIKKNFTISGNGKQVRDVLHSEDVTSLYFSAINSIDLIQGKAFNIGGGIENSLSLLELFQFLEAELDIKMYYDKIEPRISDQKFFVANNSSITKLTRWSPKVSYATGLRKMISWLKSM